MTIDKQSLREAAEKALPAMKRLLMMPNDELFDEALLNVDGDVDAANVFNLLTGPETMLALLDELEHYKSREDRVTKLVLDNSTSWDELYKKLEAAEKRIAELREWNAGLAQESCIQQQRIAELQIARDKCFLSGLKTGWAYGIADDTEGYNREISDAQAVIDRAAGIGKGE